MLVLSRKVGQSLVIAEGVTVTVSEIGSDFVRLTVEAPNEAEMRRRYPQSLDVPDAGDPGERPIVVTLTLHDAALLDRLRRRMSTEESLPPSRDAALGAILHAVAENDDFELPRLSAAETTARPQAGAAPPRAATTPAASPQATAAKTAASAAPRRRAVIAGAKPR